MPGSEYREASEAALRAAYAKWRPFSLYVPYVREGWVPTLHRLSRHDPSILSRLRPEHRTFASAGAPSGKSWTPFKETCRQVTREVYAHSGITLSDMIKSIKHHYGTNSFARACLLKWIEAGYVEGVGMRREGKIITLYRVERTENDGGSLIEHPIKVG